MSSDEFGGDSFVSADDIINTLAKWVFTFGTKPAIIMGPEVFDAGMKSPDSHRFSTDPGPELPNHWLDGVPILVDTNTSGWYIIDSPLQQPAKP